MKDFLKLETENFRKKLNSKAIDIYKSIYPNCIYSRELDINKDRAYSIDATLIFSDGQKLTIQEKYRKYKYLTCKELQVSPPYPDFTQEYKNAVGTKYENLGEYFKLFAQLYFYGWANKKQTDFVRWCIIDIPKYKDFLQNKGIDNIGALKQNYRHGKATFYAIPINNIKHCFLHSNFDFEKPNRQKFIIDNSTKQHKLF